MKSKIFFRIFPYVVIAILVGMLFINEKHDSYKPTIKTEIDSTYTPIEIDSVTTEFTPIENPKPIIKDSIVYVTNPVNQELLEKFKEATNKLELYKQAIKENDYVEVFEDTLQKVTVKSTTQGKLLKQSIVTTLKKRTIPHYTTTITNTITEQDRSKVFLGVDMSIPTAANNQFSYGVNVMYKTPSQNIWKVGVDNNKNISLGYSINLW